MPTDKALIEKREELKKRLATGEYKTLADIFLAGINRSFQRITHQSKSPPVWLIFVSLSLALFLVGFLIIYVAGDWANLLRYFDLLGFTYELGILWMILNSIMSVSNLMAIDQCTNRIFALWRDYILDLTESEVSLDGFTAWLKVTCNWRRHFLVMLIGGLLIGFYLISVLSTSLGGFIGYGFSFMLFLLFMFYPAGMYLFWVLILLPLKLQHYDLKLFTADPGSSEIMTRLSHELSFIVYIVAVYGALFALLTALTGGFQQPLVGLAEIALVWLPLIVMFILNQGSLSGLIRRAKWETLNEIQTKVEKLQTAENFADKETMDAINRLMDYHDRVKATRNSALDLSSSLNFINSLLLPLIGFLLGNLDVVLKLFRK